MTAFLRDFIYAESVFAELYTAITPSSSSKMLPWLYPPCVRFEPGSLLHTTGRPQRRNHRRRAGTQRRFTEICKSGSAGAVKGSWEGRESPRHGGRQRRIRGTTRTTCPGSSFISCPATSSASSEASSVEKQKQGYPYLNFKLPQSPSEDDAEGEPLDITPPNPDTPYYHHLHVLASTQSETEAWASYTQLLKLPTPEGFPEDVPIALSNLHRLCRLLSRSKPKNRTVFLRLLSVMYLIYRSGGQLRVFHWNALIDCAGKGLRKPRMEDFKLALDVFTDMITGKPPGATYSPSEYRAMPDLGQPIQPDIVTYTTLLNIAAKTLQGHALRQATSLLRSSGLAPNRITHLCLMAYYTSTRDLNGVRSTLIQMHSRGLELGIDGANSCIWAYAHRRLDIVRDIYRILRHSIFPEPNAEEVTSLKRKLQEEETILIPEGMLAERDNIHVDDSVHGL
ncbi:hypothetical protein EDD18DRAFT_89283 [Armillaria luteobubalina]|uniref:Pentatricopeptide repeat protein n=1 Tax=Armillaria luteobubalina TaxID=153913 RepID=A0AA39Q8X8_9AGAR|nr:hypothetical protein EDD18DRAFT_89283 [Armillaria luteobubalina]